MGIPGFALDVRKGIGILLFGPESQTVFVICWTDVWFNAINLRIQGYKDSWEVAFIPVRVSVILRIL